ncbi:hypothetical protein Hanom_Chr02g00138431 [Helianthus anomalus]
MLSQCSILAGTPYQIWIPRFYLQQKRRVSGNQVKSFHNKPNLYSSKVHEWSLWFTKILDLVLSFPRVHAWSMWFALCNAFSPQPTNLKF